MSDPKSNECDDVEITPEMIEAGAEAVWDRVPREYISYGCDPAPTLAFEVYRAMVNCREGHERIPEVLWHIGTDGRPKCCTS